MVLQFIIIVFCLLGMAVLAVTGLGIYFLIGFLNRGGAVIYHSGYLIDERSTKGAV